MAIIPEFAVRFMSSTFFIERTAISYPEHEYVENEELVQFYTSNFELFNYSQFSPILLRAWNVATNMEDPENLGTYYDDYGYCVVFEFDQHIPNAGDYPEHFKIVDNNNAQWFGQSAVVNRRFVTVMFNNFNNASSPILATALSGNLWNGLTYLEETAVSFNATNLVPFATDPPIPLSVRNVGNQVIVIDFDKPIVSINSQEGFVISANEPNTSPQGELSVTNYILDEATTETIELQSLYFSEAEKVNVTIRERVLGLDYDL